jgi:hypothetical protein
MVSLFALRAVFAAVSRLGRCGCCGDVRSRRRMRRLAATPPVAICHDCARPSARMTARKGW